MGKKKNQARRQQQRENAEFDMLELDEDPKKKQPQGLNSLSKKARKKAKKRLQLQTTVLQDVDMDTIATNKQTK